MKKLAILGNSHLTALIRGYREMEYLGEHEAQLFPMMPARYEERSFSILSEGKVIPLDDVVSDRLKKYGNIDFFSPDILWGFCMGTFSTRIYNRNKQFWFTSEPTSISLPGTRPISEAVLFAIIEKDQEFIRSFFLQLKEAGVPFFVISGPYPRQDQNCMEQGVRRETVQCIDTKARKALTHWLDEQGIDMVQPPVGTYTEDYFLKTEFNAPNLKSGAKDPTHANSAYGKLMMGKVLNYVDQITPKMES